MAWTYSESLTTARDKLRLRIGDTDTNDQLLADETLDALLTDKNSDLALAAIDAVRAIIAKFGRNFDRNAVGIQSNRSQRVQHFHDLLSQLTKEVRLSTGVVVGGLLETRKDVIENDDDFIKPSFTKGQHDQDGTSGDKVKTW